MRLIFMLILFAKRMAAPFENIEISFAKLLATDANNSF